METESAAPVRRQALPLRERRFLERRDGGQIIRQAAISEGLSLTQGKRIAREKGLK